MLGLAGFGFILFSLVQAIRDGTGVSVELLIAAIVVLIPLRLLALGAIAVRWRAWLVLGGSSPVSIAWALYVNTVANFFGAITFGTAARDAYRAGTSVASGHTLQRSVAATALDSISGAATQGVLAIALTLALTTGVAALPVIPLMAFAAVIVVLPPIITSKRNPRGLKGFLGVERSVRTFAVKAGRPALTRTLLVSIAVTLVRVGAFAAGVFLTARMVGSPLDVGDALAIGLIQSAVQFVPWVLQGIGLHDASLFGALVLFGVPPPEAATVTVAVRASLLVAALIGGVWYLRERVRPVPN